MKVLRVLSRSYRDEGVFATYHKLKGNKGVKVIKDGFDSLTELKNSRSWKCAVKELKLLKRARKSGVTPKAYQVVAVKKWDECNGTLLYPGIVMEHIKGEKINTDGADFMIDDALKQLKNKAGLVHNDIHDDNIIVKKTKHGWKLYLIDFSPCNIKEAKNKKKKGWLW